MLRFLLTRIGLLIPTFIGVSIIAFAFIRLLPGDPIILMAGERGMTEERYAELRTLYGYDKPVVVQYLNYLGGILQGDLGQSIVTKRPVVDEFFTLFPATIELSLCAIVFAVITGRAAFTARSSRCIAATRAAASPDVRAMTVVGSASDCVYEL